MKYNTHTGISRNQHHKGPFEKTQVSAKKRQSTLPKARNPRSDKNQMLLRRSPFYQDLQWQVIRADLPSGSK